MKNFFFSLFFFASFFISPKSGAGERDITKVTDSNISGSVSIDLPPPKETPRPKKKIKKKSPKGRRCHSKPSARYQRMVRRWNRVPRIPGPRYRDGYRDLVFYSVNHREKLRVFPFGTDGELEPEIMLKIKNILRDRNTGAMHDIHPRLVKLLYKLAVHFNARQITVVSGFRQQMNPGSESRHSRGQAVDIVLPGVPLLDLARKARTLGRVGVGYYPNSGFVHLDVRGRHSVFWIDRSAPGKRPCFRRLLKKTAQKFDRRWRKWHDEPKVGPPRARKTPKIKKPSQGKGSGQDRRQKPHSKPHSKPQLGPRLGRPPKKDAAFESTDSSPSALMDETDIMR